MGENEYMYMSLSKFRELVLVREAWHAAVHGIAESDMIRPLNNEKQSRASSSLKSAAIHA